MEMSSWDFKYTSPEFVQNLGRHKFGVSVGWRHKFGVSVG